jgi:hypothetical protein
MGGGVYRDVSSLVPPEVQTVRSYAFAAGDIDDSSGVEIVLLDQNGSTHALLRWNGNGFDVQRHWISDSLWGDPARLNQNSWMVVEDFDKDGRQDLLVSGQSHTPNLRILFNAAGGFTAANMVQLPEGPYGHEPPSSVTITQGANPEPVIAADLNNDGLKDVFAIHEQIAIYPPGTFTDTDYPDYAEIRANGGGVVSDYAVQVLLNQGSRTFVDMTTASTASSAQRLGRLKYNTLIPRDMNNDGFTDVLGLFQTQFYAGIAPQWGTTLFLNDGTGAFQIVDGAQLLPAVTTTPSNGSRWNLGSFVPTVVTPQRTEGIVFESLGSCALGFCPPAGINLYRVVADRSIGTGPGFEDSTALGVPGFNEFYYLRHYSDAAAAVQQGTYPNGLAHYLAVGRDRNYRPFARGARVPFTDAQLTTAATPVRAAHIAELRTRINLLRAAYHLAPAAFSDTPLIAGQSTIKADHVLELRAALVEVYIAARRTPPAFTDAVTRGGMILASHVRELRDAVQTIE